MATLQVELVAVERMIWSGEASMVIARTTEGELGVLPGHAPLLGELAEQRRVPGKDTELTLGRAGDEHLGLTGPDLLFDRHKLDVQLPCHASYSSCA